VQLVVGRVAKAHGVGGEVAVEVRTDSPELRFAVDASLATEPADRGPLTVRAIRWHAGRLLVRFDGVTSRTAAEALRNTLLVADSTTSPDLGPEEFWEHDLVGLTARLRTGDPIGEVVDVRQRGGSAMLLIRRSDDTTKETLVPFVTAIVPEVDVANGVVVVDPPDGLLDL